MYLTLIMLCFEDFHEYLNVLRYYNYLLILKCVPFTDISPERILLKLPAVAGEFGAAMQESGGESVRYGADKKMKMI